MDAFPHVHARTSPPQVKLTTLHTYPSPLHSAITSRLLFPPFSVSRKQRAMDIIGGVRNSKGSMCAVNLLLLLSALLVVTYYSVGAGFPALPTVQPVANVSKSEEPSELSRVLGKAAMADKTVILTYLNDAWAEPGSVFDLLLESMRIGNNTQRLEKHMVVVSLDPKAHARCVALNLNCYFLHLTGFNFSKEAFYMTPAYKEMMWRRLDFLHSVLQLGYNFLFTDCDIMWFRDPFQHLHPDADFQIACDQFFGNPWSVVNQPNAGFKYVRSNKHTILFYKLWYYSRKLYEGKNEQEVFNFIKHGPLFKIIGLKVKFLDTAYFAGFCEESNDFDKVCTMHANCCLGLKNKVNDLKLIIGDWRNYSSLISPKKPPYPFKWSAPKMCWHRSR